MSLVEAVDGVTPVEAVVRVIRADLLASLIQAPPFRPQGRRCSRRSLDVLHLLPNLLDQHLRIDRMPRRLRIG